MRAAAVGTDIPAGEPFPDQDRSYVPATDPEDTARASIIADAGALSAWRALAWHDFKIGRSRIDQCLKSVCRLHAEIQLGIATGAISCLRSVKSDQPNGAAVDAHRVAIENLHL